MEAKVYVGRDTIPCRLFIVDLRGSANLDLEQRGDSAPYSELDQSEAELSDRTEGRSDGMTEGRIRQQSSCVYGLDYLLRIS